jgi:hypothetical protein
VPDEVRRITTDDLTGLNRAELRRVAGIARWVATGLFVVAGIGAAAWAWQLVRQQQQAGGFAGPFGDDGLSFADRIDLAVNGIVLLVLAAVLAGAGVLVRLFADVVVDRADGTLCGYEVGDEVDPPADDPDDDDDDFGPLTPFRRPFEPG